MMSNKQPASKAGKHPSKAISEEVISEVANRLWQSMDKDVPFEEFEEAVLEAGNDIVRDLGKKNSKG